MNIKPFIDNYNWEKVNYPSKIEDWKRFEKNYLTISLNLSYIIEKKCMSCLYFKNNSSCEKLIILLMLLNEENEGWHYFAITKLLALLRGITSKHNPDFYCLNSLHSFAIKKFNLMKSV